MKRLFYTLTMLNMLLSSMVYGQVPTTGLVGEYKFTGGVLTDGISTNDFTQTGSSLTSVTDRFSNSGDAVDLNGDYLRRSTISTSNMTVSFWIKTSTNDASKRTIIDQSNRAQHFDNTNEQGWYTYLINGTVGLAANYYHSHVSNGNVVGSFTGYAYTGGTTNIADGNWHHIAVSAQKSIFYSGGWIKRYTYKVYIDGVLEGSQNVDRGSGGSSSNISANLIPNVPITVAQNQNSNLTDTYQDEIDDIRIYTGALSAASIVNLHAEDPCIPFDIVASTIGETSAEISWTSQAGQTSWDVAIVESGQPVDNATIISGTTNNPASITGLTPFTDYDVYVRSNCGGGLSDWSDVESFTTSGKIYVNANASGANNGLTWNDAFTDIQSALSSNLGADIWVASGTYTPGASDRKSTFNIPHNTKLYGGFVGTETNFTQRDPKANVTVLSGDLSGNDNATILHTEATRQDNAYHVVSIKGNAQSIVIDGFTITGGNANGSTDASCSTAAVNQFYDVRGGAIYINPYTANDAPSASITNCILEKNTGTNVAVFSYFTPCGVSNLSFDVDFENSIIRNNYSHELSAMIYYGSSGYDLYGYGSIVNCLFYDNVSNASASSIYLGTSTASGGNTLGLDVEIINSTFANNTGVNGNVITMARAGNTTIKNSIIHGNGSSSPLSITTSGSTVSNSIIEGGQQGGTNSDPQFNDEANDDYTLYCTSPAIDAGNSVVTLPATDIAGNNRVQNTLDMGAYEFSESIYGSITAVTKDITVELDGTGNASITADDVNDGSGAACGVAFTLGLDVSAFTCADLGDNVVTLTATEDAGGANDQTTATVTVVYPVIAQDITVQLDGTGNVSIAAADIDNGTNATCTTAFSLSLDKTDFTCADLGDNVVTLSADDGAGNIRTATATVTVENSITVVTQDISVQLDASGSTTVTADMIDDGSSDNCSGLLTMSLSKTEFTCSDAGVNIVTLTVEDESGNQATATANVTISSTFTDATVTATDAEFCSSGNSTTITTGGSDSDLVYYLRNSVNDDIVDGPIQGNGSGLTFNTGVINATTTYNVYAESKGNYALDFDGVDDDISLGTDGRNIAGSVTMAAWIKTGSPNGVQFIASKYNGATGAALIMNASGQVAIDGRDGSGGYKTSGVSSSFVTDNQWHYVVGSISIITGVWRIYVDGVLESSATNATGSTLANSSDFTVGSHNSTGFFNGQIDQLTVWNIEVPQATIIANMSDCLTGSEAGVVGHFKLDEGSGTTVTDLSSTALNGTMNMDAASDWIGITGPTCTKAVCGFEMTSEATVTIEDSVNPIVVAQDITLQLDANGSAFITTDDINNGSSDNCTADNALILSLSKTSFTCSEIGNNTVTLTVEDLGGNTATTSVTVTVLDEILPTVVTQNISVELDAAGTASITTTDINNGSSDNCTSEGNLLLSLDKTNFTCTDIGNNTVTLTVEDAYGNISNMTANVLVEDVISPTAIAMDITVNLDASGVVSVDPSTVDNGSNDFCTNNLSLDLSQANFSCSDIGANSVTLTVTDDSGNSSTATSTITVVDDIVPVALAQDITVQLDANNMAVITASDVDNSSSDNCSFTMSLNIDSFNETHLGANTVTLTVEDMSGNSSSATAIVTIEEYKQDQTISFTEVADKTYGDANFTISANASSGLSVTYAVISGPAAMSGNTLSLTGIGTVIVEATQAGNDEFYSASVQQSFSVQKATLSVTANSQSIVYGDALPALTFEYSGFVNGETRADLTQEPIISTTATNTSDAGTYAIALTGGEADNYVIVKTDGELTINKADQSISLEEINDKQSTDNPFDVVASASSGLEVTYIVSGPATISGSTITLDGTNGTVIVTVSQTGNVNYNAAESMSVSFEVSDILAVGDDLKKSVSIYPNPVTDFVVIDTDEPVSLNFYSLQGELVKSLVNVRGHIQLSDLRTGHYLMEVIFEHDRLVRKILKRN
ncbi:MAG: fibronectin type III domain-containing protein [Reichenbachiella sp.]